MRSSAAGALSLKFVKPANPIELEADSLHSGDRPVGGSEMTRISNRFLRLGVLAALIGMTLGWGMGAKQDVTLAPVHAHLNLLGWVSMMIYGMFYRICPNAGRGWMATSQFWLAVVGLLFFIPSLALLLLGQGNHQAEAAGGAVGAALTMLSMALFAAIVIGATREQAATTARA